MKNKKILLCDDNLKHRNLYKKSFEEAWLKLYSESINIQICEDIVDEVELTNQVAINDVGTFDLLLLDIFYDKLNEPHGIEIAKKVKTNFPEIPIIVLSAKVNTRDFKNLIPLISGYFPKREDDIERWCETINEIINKTTEDKIGQEVYKELRKLKVDAQAWEIETINEAASKVWQQENGSGKWLDFWEVLTNMLGKKNLFKPFQEMTESFKENDLINLGILPSMRGHLEHVLHVYFTGYILSHRIPIIKETFYNVIQKIGLNNEGKKDLYWDYFQFAWLACATLHDTAYSFELLPELIDKIKQAEKLFPYIKLNHKIELISEIIPEPDNKYLKYARESFNYILLNLHRDVIPSDWIFENLVFDFKGKKRVNHGIASGILFLQKVFDRKEILKSDKDFEIFLQWAATAMSLHSLKHQGKGSGHSIHLKNDPLSFLLMLCDEIQVWNRERPDANTNTSKFKQIDISSISIAGQNICFKIKYIPYPKTDLTRKEHINPIVENVNKDNEILKTYLKTDPLNITIEYSVQGHNEKLPTIVLD
jgi:CheY-like chemotaxis protein